MTAIHCRRLPIARGATLATVVLAGLAGGLCLTDAASARGGRDAKREEFVQTRPAGAPVMAVVSLSRQRVTVYDADGWIMRAPVSSGRTGYETPAGIYSILQRKVEHFSNLYDDAEMPFMQRLTWSGIALHAGALPGYPASHGCVRMPHGFAERLFDVTPARHARDRDARRHRPGRHLAPGSVPAGAGRANGAAPASVVALWRRPPAGRDLSEPAQDRGGEGGGSGGGIPQAGGHEAVPPR